MDATSWNYRASSCIGKEQFSTPQLANKVMRRRGKKSGMRKQQAYKCQCCGYFHIGRPSEPRHTKASTKSKRNHKIREDDGMAI